MKTVTHRVKFILYLILMLISLFLGGVAIAYRWEILWVLFFTLLFALFLILAGYVYMSSQRDSAYDVLRKQKAHDEEDARRRIEYFANMSHEIRTPINAILGYDELILREYNDPALRQYAYNIRSAGNTLLSLINDSLDYSRIEAGKMELFPNEYDLSVVIEDMMSLIRPRALAKGLNLKGYVNENIPRRLYGDADRLKQCIANILTNAVKYTEDGEIDFSVDYEKIESNASFDNQEILLKVAVRDTGIGIKKEDLQRLYRPFERIEEEKIKTIEGSGLGISIVRQILSLMGSELQVESIYGEGSNFHFAIKQKVVGSEPIGDFEQTYARSVMDKDHFTISFTAPDAKVLVVDDAELNLAVMESLLNGTGIQVDSALSAQTGLELAMQNKYDIIFIDLMMPGMSGREMTSRLKGTEGINSDTTCIALTAGARQEVRSEYKKQGFADYLLKPVVFKELESILLRYIPDEKIVKKSSFSAKRKNPGLPVLASEEKFQEALKILSQREA
ncbi:ATP-binding protein [Butyrivibrio sp. JL13D10]|uniref:ATP-binding protein n=1 Tax=Butyrivibrio sp. JL13D10 TaxID=3236815 RepID=UPI0038B62D4F